MWMVMTIAMMTLTDAWEGIAQIQIQRQIQIAQKHKYIAQLHKYILLLTDAWEGIAHGVLHPGHPLLLRGQQVVLPHLDYNHH